MVKHKKSKSVEYRHPTGNSPEVVDLVSLGPSQREYHSHLHAAYTPQIPRPDEVWTLNKGIRTIVSDLAFVLDDLEGERRKSQVYADDLLAYAKHRPIITSELTRPEREYWKGKFHDYPLTYVVDQLGMWLCSARGMEHPTRQQAREVGMGNCLYLHNSVPMILAYALAIGVRELRLYGADYVIRNSDHMEENRPNCEYWVGFCRGMGMQIKLPQTTTLLNTDLHKPIYGYARPPILGAVE